MNFDAAFQGLLILLRLLILSSAMTSLRMFQIEYPSLTEEEHDALLQRKREKQQAASAAGVEMTSLTMTSPGKQQVTSLNVS